MKYFIWTTISIVFLLITPDNLKVIKAADNHGRDALYNAVDTLLDAIDSSNISPHFDSVFLLNPNPNPNPNTNPNTKPNPKDYDMGWLSETTRRNAPLYAKQFREATLFPHISIDGFMTAEVAETLLAEFPKFENGNYLNEYGLAGKKSVQPNLRSISDKYAKLWKYIGSEEFLGYISEVTGIPDLLMDPSMFGGGTHENLKGQKLNTHIDFNYSRDKRWHRRVNVLYYVNKEWDCEWGGCIIFEKNPLCFDDKCNPKKEYKVEFNRAVIFATSEKSWHGFKEINTPENYKGSRKLISIYLYTRDRPADETAAEHSTVYVPNTQLKIVDEQLYFKYLIQTEVSLHQQMDAMSAEINKLTLNSLTNAKNLKNYGLTLVKLDGLHSDGWVEKGAYMELKVKNVKNVLIKNVTFTAYFPDVMISSKMKVSVYVEQEHFTWKVGETQTEGSNYRNIQVNVTPTRILNEKDYVMSIHFTADKSMPMKGDDKRELVFIMNSKSFRFN